MKRKDLQTVADETKNMSAPSYVPKHIEKHTPTPRAMEMFKAISETTNFPELCERPEWLEIKTLLVRAINSHMALLEVSQQIVTWANSCPKSIVDLALKALVQAEGK